VTCYDETRDKDSQFSPRVQRDGLNVREIADDPAAFIGHVRPRRKADRDSNDGRDTEE
jgi:hypothetical protein